MRQRVYVETTIPSFYYEVRSEPEMVARRLWTKQWWDEERSHYEVVSSVAVLDELERGKQPNKELAIEMMKSIPLLPFREEVVEIVNTYIKHQVMPAEPMGDALHLALASFHRCRFLLTWNCAHLANANKFAHIRHVNTILGLTVPALITPVELLHWE